MDDAHQRILEIERRRWRKIVALAVMLIILFAPSAWMLKTIPPLWKDVDAYGQVTAPPGEATILLYGPAYCSVARVPLYLGFAYQCCRANVALPPLSFFLHPQLTDTGVFLLLLTQHLALCASGCLLIISVTPLLLLRVTMAMLWAANPLFYAWAHCVSTEALSSIVLLLLVVTGLHVLREPKWQWWLCYAILLTLSMLTRHINGVLCALLPLGFGFAAVARGLLVHVRRKPEARRAVRPERTRVLRQTLCAIVVGLLCIVLSNFTVRLLSRAAGISYHSTVGFTFMFRLGLFASLSPAERDELIRHVVKANTSANIRILLEVFRNAPAGKEHLNIAEILGQSRKLFPASCRQGDDFEHVLNDTAYACLLSPSQPYLRAVGTDFIKSFTISISQVIAAPFVHTMFYFSHPQWMTQCAHLKTFTDQDQSTVLRQLHSYTGQRQEKLRYDRLLLCWLALLLIYAWRARAEAIALSAYTFALNVTSLLIITANCVLNEFQPRYTLPAWELLIVSIFIMLGALVRAMPGHGVATGPVQHGIVVNHVPQARLN